MKRILPLIFFLIIGKDCFSTEWSWYYIYVQTEYMQGPWIRTDVFHKSGRYTYLYPKQYEELFGTEKIDLANAIFNHLQKETESPNLYKYKYALSLLSDTVVITTKGSIPNLEAIKNELTASFTLNSFAAVKIIQPDTTMLYQLNDISLPYMDLISPPSNVESSLAKTPVNADSIKNGTMTSPCPISNTKPENNISFWLIISVIGNVGLIVLLLRRKK